MIKYSTSLLNKLRGDSVPLCCLNFCDTNNSNLTFKFSQFYPPRTPVDHNTELILRGWEQLCQNFPQQKTNIGKYSIDFTLDKEIEDKLFENIVFTNVWNYSRCRFLCAIFLHFKIWYLNSWLRDVTKPEIINIHCLWFSCAIFKFHWYIFKYLTAICNKAR